MKSYKKVLALCTLALSSCSSGPHIQEIPPTANVVEELNSFERDLNAANTNQANVLSPHNFSEASKSLTDAKKSLEKQKASAVTLHNIARGRAYLVRSNEVTALAHTDMEEVVTARLQALNAGAPTYFADDFKDADERLREVSSDLEDNKVKSAAENRTPLQTAYLALELRAIRQTVLGSAQKINAQALRDGAKEYAPQSLAIAEKNYKDTDAYITANRHDVDQIAARAKIVNQSSDHLYKITHMSKDSKKVSSEELALQLESKQNQVIAKQNDLTLEQGVSKSLNAEKQNLRADNKVLESEKQDLKVNNRSLESEKRFNAKFDTARGQFTKEEAEVYKQGNSLVIRLRGLEFPKSQAVLRGSNFPLLAKVQNVIKDFENSSVVVEGHTDSIGGLAANEKLSTGRAQAVTEYLISKDGISKDKIKAIGYGYQKPLATNKTPEGRAQNRRVDIVIEPDLSQTL